MKDKVIRGLDASSAMAAEEHAVTVRGWASWMVNQDPIRAELTEMEAVALAESLLSAVRAHARVRANRLNQKLRDQEL